MEINKWYEYLYDDGNMSICMNDGDRSDCMKDDMNVVRRVMLEWYSKVK